MKFMWNEKEWYIDGYLAARLDSLIYNLNKDWDFVIMITGDRGVRVGKSVLAMTVCAYLAYLLDKKKLNKNAYGVEDIYFDNIVMMDQSQKKPKYSINHYDEGREGLAANKAMKSFQQDLIDFFTECGQLNQIFVIVAPDFFELKEDMAVARSECLINVYRKETIVNVDFFRDGGAKRDLIRLDRGFFEYFGRKSKAKLYDKAKTSRKKNYGLVKANFVGRFVNQYPVDEEIYKEKKAESLRRFKERHEEQKMSNTKTDVFRDRIILDLSSKGLSGAKIAVELEEKWKYKLGKTQVNNIIKKYRDRGEFEQ